MNRKQLLLLIVSLLLIVLSWIGVTSARQGLIIRHFNSEGIPMVLIAPKQRQKLPGVLVAHGFAGSKQLMLGYGYTLAHSGQAVLLWDFKGHAANPHPFDYTGLQPDLDVAYRTLIQQPEVDANRVALLGHSIGSSVVMSSSIDHPDRFAATVAISPMEADVTPQRPQNLQLQVGAWEDRLIPVAERLLASAGGANANLSAGVGRSLVVVPRVEHITILLSRLSHAAARSWLNQTFEQTAMRPYVDRRMAWYGLHLLAWLGVLAAVAPTLQSPSQTVILQPLRCWGGLLLGPVTGTAVLWLLSQTMEIEALGGILVGGALGIWFGVAGLTWLGVLDQWPRPTLTDLEIGCGVFLLLWLGFGAMAQTVWLQWWLIPARLMLWPLLSLACLPWFLASGLAQVGIGPGKRVLWWLGQSGALIGGLVLMLIFVPRLGFVAILLPVFPVLLALLSFTAAQVGQNWQYGMAGALFWGWAIAATFPLTP